MSDHDEELGEEDGSESEEIRITKVLDRRHARSERNLVYERDTKEIQPSSTTEYMYMYMYMYM